MFPYMHHERAKLAKIVLPMIIHAHSRDRVSDRMMITDSYCADAILPVPHTRNHAHTRERVSMDELLSRLLKSFELAYTHVRFVYTHGHIQALTSDILQKHVRRTEDQRSRSS
jgi:hypothetical protein